MRFNNALEYLQAIEIRLTDILEKLQGLSF